MLEFESRPAATISTPETSRSFDGGGRELFPGLSIRGELEGEGRSRQAPTEKVDLNRTGMYQALAADVEDQLGAPDRAFGGPVGALQLMTVKLRKKYLV